MIKAARSKTFYEINRTVIELYWEIGKHLHAKSSSEGWGKATVRNLAVYLSLNVPNTTGFSVQNLWRMKQFYETYQADEKLSPLVREIS